MKVLHLNVVYPYGSTGKIVESVHENLLKNDYESYVIYGRGTPTKEVNIKKNAPELLIKFQSLRSKLSGIAYGGSFLSTWILKKRILKLNPDIIHIHVINANMVNIYSLMNFLKKHKVNTVLTLHAEYMYTAGCSHALDCNKWKKGCHKCPQKGNGRPSSKIFDRSKKEWKLMSKSLHNFDKLNVTCVSGWLYERAIQSPFLKNKDIEVVLNGVNEKIFSPTFEVPEAMKERRGKKVLHITSGFNHYLKGSQYVLELAKEFATEDITFYIVGVKEKPKTSYSNIVFIEPIYDQYELARYYSNADITILTSYVETFSMVTAESLLCGTPVVGFKAGGPESIALDNYSEFVDYGNINMLSQVVRKFLNKPKESKTISNLAKEKYSEEKMYSRFLNIYERVMK